jgi:hypothetical protein
MLQSQLSVLGRLRLESGIVLHQKRKRKRIKKIFPVRPPHFATEWLRTWCWKRVLA